MAARTTTLATLFVGLVVCGTSGAQQGQRAVEFSADRTEMIRRGDRFLKRYTGAVVIRFGPGEWLTADEATYDSDGRNINIAGSVVMQDSGRILRADRVQYLFRDNPRAGGHPLVLLLGRVALVDNARRLNADRAEYRSHVDSLAAFGDVVAKDSSRTVTADTLLLKADGNRFVAMGRVVLEDTVENVTVRAGYYSFDGADSVGVIAREPTLVRGAGDTAVTVRADSMILNVTGKKGSAWGTVRIEKGQMTAECDSLALDDNRGTIALFGRPHAVQKRQEDSTSTVDHLWGDRIMLELEQSKITRILVDGSARTSSTRSDSRGGLGPERWATGSQMVFHVEHDEVREVIVWGQARSRYEPDFEDARESGTNEAAGDTIRVAFRDGKPVRVHLAGGVHGLYVQNVARRTDATTRAASPDERRGG
ncbi:MAG TPA: hypothetical protein PLM66_07040 [Candidatus Latescibacteria bacterium]|nr:hypothetical protein [Candidatus Latescibacterota bacterium]